ncbi:TolC family protein [Bacteroides sp. 519]|uniref:TolC family protein n=1 Tax=Bacteroides sp. 519 TaxID=2302937 RepID=UPI0013D8339A|nr:TolC family protein [Bacteroides sp. 519]NDV59073.1 TolC family protein [Bacteroides sp. 519]
MKQRIVLITAIATLFASSVSAQQGWTLRQCIDHAIANNLTIRKAQIDVDQSEIEVNTNKWARLPNLNANVNESLGWGRNVSDDNTYIDDIHSTNTNFNLSTNVPLFTGFELPNRYQLSKLNLKAAFVDLEKAKEDIAVNVASQYVQVLYNLELKNVAKEQVILSSEQLNRMEKLQEVGKASPAEVAEARARLAQSEMSSVEAENNYQLSLLNLSQLLELPTPEGFTVAPMQVDPDFKPLTPPDDIYTDALNYKPGILAAQYRLEGSERSIRIAQSGYYPTLSFNANISSGYTTYNGKGDSFFEQLKNKRNQSIGFSLSIPIFNRFATRNQVRTARLQHTNYSILLDETKKDLYKEIQQSWYNAVAAETKYKTSAVAVEANQESFRLMTEKFENGKATSIEYNEAKLNLMKSISDRIQAKYNYIFSTKILDFYKGIPIE